VRGWNWGACLATPLGIWPFAHRLRRLAIAAAVISVTPVAAVFVLAFAIYLGKHGNELAWRHRPFRSLEEFQATQLAWRRWGIRVWVALVALVLAAWPPLHLPASEHRDCARCHLKHTRRFLQQRREQRQARPRDPLPAHLATAVPPQGSSPRAWKRSMAIPASPDRGYE